MSAPRAKPEGICNSFDGAAHADIETEFLFTINVEDFLITPLAHPLLSRSGGRGQRTGSYVFRSNGDRISASDI